MRRVAIIQARMGSTRLPGKVLAPIGGHPMLGHIIRRLRQSSLLDDIVIATTDSAADVPIVTLAKAEGARWFRGDESDVLRRYCGAAHDARADIVVRITADCPLIDPGTVDSVIESLETSSPVCDYASNVIERTFPRGLDAEALSIDCLDRLNRAATSGPAREHVTFHLLHEEPGSFTRRSVRDQEDHSDLRWTVDQAEDLLLIQRIYADLSLAERNIPYKGVLSYVLSRPDLIRINAHVDQKVL